MIAARGAKRPSRIASLVYGLSVTRSACRAIAGYMFHRYFRAVAVAASNEDLRDETFRIRYEVYCDELHYEDAGNFPDKREIDPYDEFSLHCLLYHGASKTYAGCVRLVLANPERPDDPFPFERTCKDTIYAGILAKLAPDRTKVAEISRLAVRSVFRRRKGEQKSAMGLIDERNRGLGRARTPWIPLGLYLSAAALGVIKGFDGVFAMMEPSLARRLGSYGIKFVQVGGPVEHRGQRAPFFISREALYAGVPPLVRGLLDVVENDLRKTGAERMTARKPMRTQ